MPSSGRYQSRVFSFLSQQRLKLSDRLQRVVRQTKLAAVWSAQIVIYPVYLAFQSTRYIGKQLRRAADRVLPRLQALRSGDAAIVPTRSVAIASDTPIRNTLKAAQQMIALLPVAAQPEASDPIASIASDLGDRSLLLLTRHQQTLDTLSIDQQVQLQRQIVWELANYYRQQHILQSGQAPVLPLLPPVERETMVLPVKLFYRLMGWMQRGSVAIATNLFQESALALYFSEVEQSGLESSSAPSLGFLEGLAAMDAVEVLAMPLPAASAPQLAPGQIDPLPQARHLRPSPVSPGEWLVQLLQQSAPKRAPGGPLVQTQKPEVVVAAPAGRLTTAAEPEPSGSVVVVSETVKERAIAPPEAPLPPPVLPDPDPYIETKATLVGYVKHPLEQLLEWLDGAMLWLEDRFARLWDWLKKPS